MIEAGVKDGAYLLVRKSEELIDGAIMAVKYRGDSFVKLIELHEGMVHLVW
jgi:SOS-response transcriptional repressor LexA